MEATCPRCGGATGDSRWCPTCGKELTGRPALPTPETAEAARRELAWLDAHPDAATAEEAERERQRAASAPQAHMHAAMRAEPPADPSGRARVVRWLLWASVLAAVVATIMEIVYLGVLGDLTDSEFATSTKRDNALAALGLTYILQTILLLVTAGFFIAWLFRVYKNVRGLGAGELRHSEGWAIGGWFIPFVWWVMPKRIVNDAWRASDPNLPFFTTRGEWENARVPFVIHAWWALWILWSIGNNLASRSFDSATTVDGERSAMILTLCLEPVVIAAAVLAIRTVTIITERQSERAAARERMAVPPAPATA